MRWKLLAVMLVTVISLAVVLWGIDLGKATDSLRQFRAEMFLPLLLIFVAAALLRAFRFSLLLDAPVDFKSMFGVVAVSFLAVNVVPLRMGEFVRPYLLHERHRVPWGTGLAAVVTERLLDLLGLLSLMLIVAVNTPDLHVVVAGIDVLTVGQRTIGAAALVVMVGIVALTIAGEAGVSAIERVIAAMLPSAAAPFGRLGRTLVGGFRSFFRRPWHSAGALLCTVQLWTIGVFSAVCAMRGFPGLTLGLDGILFSWAATLAAMNLMPTPGFVGSFDGGAIGSLVVLGIDADLARAYALGFHAFMFSFNAIVGLLFAFTHGIDVVAAVRRSRTAS